MVWEGSNRAAGLELLPVLPCRHPTSTSPPKDVKIHLFRRGFLNASISLDCDMWP
jgi:hypothetical protein